MVLCPLGWEYNTTGLFETAVMDVCEHGLYSAVTLFINCTFFADGLALSRIMEGSLHAINLLCGGSHRHGIIFQGKIVA